MITELPIYQAGLGKKYAFRRQILPSGQSTPHTPTVSYARVKQTKPEVWLAVRTAGRDKLVIVKRSHENDGNVLLKNEADALARLNRITWIPVPGLQIVPRLDSHIRYEDRHSFIAYEWLPGEKWKNLGELLDQGFQLEPDTILNLHQSLYNAIRLLHFMGVVHGDIKDDHVLVRRKSNGSFDFRDIRLIDFGLSYMDSNQDWRGASLGFSSPHYWHEENRSALTWSELRMLDWDGADALLYYAITGECFPITSPAYRKVTGSARKQIEFQERLRYTLRQRLLRIESPELHPLICYLIKRLSKPAQIDIPGVKDYDHSYELSPAHTWRFSAGLFGVGLMIQLVQSLWPLLFLLILPVFLKQLDRKNGDPFLLQTHFSRDFLLFLGLGLIGLVAGFLMFFYRGDPTDSRIFVSAILYFLISLMAFYQQSRAQKVEWYGAGILSCIAPVTLPTVFHASFPIWLSLLTVRSEKNQHQNFLFKKWFTIGLFAFIAGFLTWYSSWFKPKTPLNFPGQEWILIQISRWLGQEWANKVFGAPDVIIPGPTEFVHGPSGLLLLLSSWFISLVILLSRDSWANQFIAFERFKIYKSLLPIAALLGWGLPIIFEALFRIEFAGSTTFWIAGIISVGIAWLGGELGTQETLKDHCN